MNTLSRRSRTDIVHTKMVLNITRTFSRGLNSTTEFTENGFIGLTNDVGKDIKTTTMGHTNDNGFNTKIDRAINLRYIFLSKMISSFIYLFIFLKKKTKLTKAFIPGIKVSPPSRPKRFSEGYFEATKRSKLSDHVRRSRMTRFSSVEYL
jgi:hypothetical protein